jgi:hypothetical protein
VPVNFASSFKPTRNKSFEDNKWVIRSLESKRTDNTMAKGNTTRRQAKDSNTTQKTKY